ncbi:hypothetical protein Q9L58_000602 [Maublancomyces gigas]|uniref:Phospholipid/glycerol acyltransferase domain-containing protein n=1 Tax=Discina gigas TaxID=1032678 RepID=A0ABR3GWJ3_9PEZI
MATTHRSASSPQGILRALTFLIPWSLHLLLANLLLTLTLVPSLFIPLQTYAFNSQIAYSVWKAIQNLFERKRGARISFSGDPLPQHENALVVANHVSWTDFYLIQAVAARAGMLGSSRYFAKSQLKWVPLLGWGLVAMGMPMVTRDWTSDRREFQALFEGIKNGGWPICKLLPPIRTKTWPLLNRFSGLIAYSESTRFTQKKWEETREFLSSRGKSALPYVLYPRTKGFVAAVQSLRNDSQIKHVYDLTLAYSRAGKGGFMSAPTIWESFAFARVSPPWKFHVHIRRFELKDLPEDEEGVRDWLEGRWAEKSKILQGMEGEWTEFEGLGELIDYQ